MINFTSQDIKLPNINQRQIARWIRAVAADYGFTVGKTQTRCQQNDLQRS